MSLRRDRHRFPHLRPSGDPVEVGFAGHSVKGPVDVDQSSSTKAGIRFHSQREVRSMYRVVALGVAIAGGIIAVRICRIRALG